tara:strand:- start:3612 stop:4346 length:735 start_codon:yes stop_codon:yes gene_type:complete
MNIDTMIEWLKKTEIPLTTISKKTKISRKTLYNWLNGGVIRPKSYQKIYDAYKDDINLINTDIKLKEGKGKSNMEAQYIIDLQKEKIERLEKDLNRLIERPFQSTQWNGLNYHFYSVLKISYSFPNNLTRKMTQLDNRDKIEHYLGYSQKEIDKIWDIGTLYKKFNDHPVNTIVAKQSLDAIDEKVRTMPTLFESLKDMVGNFYIPVPISFIRKDGSIQHSVTYNKIHWIAKKIESKTEFIIDD